MRSSHRYTAQKGAELEFSSQAGRAGTDHHSSWRIEFGNDLCRPNDFAPRKIIRFVASDDADALVVVTKLDSEGMRAAECRRREKKASRIR
jgi:hypothetical protein